MKTMTRCRGSFWTLRPLVAQSARRLRREAFAEVVETPARGLAAAARGASRTYGKTDWSNRPAKCSWRREVSGLEAGGKEVEVITSSMYLMLG